MVAVYLITILLSVVYIIVGHKLATEGLTAFDGAQDTPISNKASSFRSVKERQTSFRGRRRMTTAVLILSLQPKF